MRARRTCDSSARCAGLLALVGGLVLLPGCATLDATMKQVPATMAAAPAKPVAKTGSTPAAADRREPAVAEGPPTSPAQQALNAGIELYNNGEYNAAIRKLAAPDIAAADRPTQVSALKYAAFSYCVTKRQTACRQQFVKAFRLDPAFELAPGEKGHPLWTPAFEQAKKTTRPKK